MSGYNYESFGQCDVGAPDFWSVAGIGTKAPDFSLPDLDGDLRLTIVIRWQEARLAGIRPRKLALSDRCGAGEAVEIPEKAGGVLEWVALRYSR